MFSLVVKIPVNRWWSGMHQENRTAFDSCDFLWHATAIVWDRLGCLYLDVLIYHKDRASENPRFLRFLRHMRTRLYEPCFVCFQSNVRDCKLLKQGNVRQRAPLYLSILALSSTWRFQCRVISKLTNYERKRKIRMDGLWWEFWSNWRSMKRCWLIRLNFKVKLTLLVMAHS